MLHGQTRLSATHSTVITFQATGSSLRRREQEKVRLFFICGRHWMTRFYHSCPDSDSASMPSRGRFAYGFYQQFPFMLAFGRLMGRSATLTWERSLSYSWIDWSAMLLLGFILLFFRRGRPLVPRYHHVFKTRFGTFVDRAFSGRDIGGCSMDVSRPC